MRDQRTEVPGARGFLLALSFVGLAAAPVVATPIDIFVDTGPLLGTAGNLAFDFLDSDPASNTVTIINFSTDGVLGAAAPVGGPITGFLPGDVTIQDGDFFNELLQEISFGSTLSFRLEPTAFTVGGIFPDSFSFFLLDPALLPLFPTSDPTGADALFTIDIDGSPTGQVTTFAATGPPPGSSELVTFRVSSVPEPATIWLVAVGIAGVVGLRRRYDSAG